MCNALTDDLQSQLQDLQEAHETAVHNLARSEKELTEMRDRNSLVQTNRAYRELEEENASLREQVSSTQVTIYNNIINNQ